MSILAAGVFILCLGIGLFSRLSLLRFLVYTMPFIAGNMIYSFRIPVDIGRMASVAIIVLACLKLPRWSPFLHPILKKAVAVWAFTMTITVVGVVLAAEFSDSLEMWTQSPAERAFRAGLRYAIFWLLPIAVAMLIKNSTETRILLRDFIRAGIFYGALGILQLGTGLAFGIDLFPIIRTANDGSMLLQHMIGDAGGRITSLCGEPRYFSGFLTVWLVFTIACGPLAGIRSSQIRGLSLFFLGTNILTGSRTGLAQLAMILPLLLILCLVQRERRLIRRTTEIMLVALAGVLVIVSVQGLILRGRMGIGEDSTNNDQVEIAGLSLPIEFQDAQPMLILAEKPLGLVAGFGGGLWQYWSDPYANALYRRYYFNQGAQSLNSSRQNINALAFLIDFGLLGGWFIFRFYRFCFGLAETGDGLALRRDFKPVVSVLLVVTAVGALTDTYSHLMVFLVLTLWVQTTAERRLRARATDSTWKQPEVYTYGT